MKKFKWRIALSALNVMLAALMCTFGRNEYRAAHSKYPEYFYHGNLYYIPMAQLVSYCLNAPALAASNLFRNLGMKLAGPSSWFTAYWFFYVYPGYFVAVFLFWWIVGWRFDVGSVISVTHKVLKTASSVMAATLSLLLAYYGLLVLREQYVALALAISMILWGIGLSLYLIVIVIQLQRYPQTLPS